MTSFPDPIKPPEFIFTSMLNEISEFPLLRISYRVAMG
jgi:hypothetical protein